MFIDWMNANINVIVPVILAIVTGIFLLWSHYKTVWKIW